MVKSNYFEKVIEIFLQDASDIKTLDFKNLLTSDVIQYTLNDGCGGVEYYLSLFQL